MQYSKLIVIAAGLAALAACGDNSAEDDTLNADLNTMATDNLAMPPAEDVTIDANNVTVVDNNAAAMGANVTTNTDNTTNAY